MRVGRCLVDVDDRTLLRVAENVRALADVRAVLQARCVLDAMLDDAIEAAWAAGASRVALARLLGIHRTVLYRRMSNAGDPS